MATISLSPGSPEVVALPHHRWNVFFENLTPKSTPDADLINTIHIIADGVPALTIPPGTGYLLLANCTEIFGFSARWHIYKTPISSWPNTDRLVGRTEKSANMMGQLTAAHSSGSTLSLRALGLVAGESHTDIIRASAYPAFVRIFSASSSLDFDPARCVTQIATTTPTALDLSSFNPRQQVLWARNPETSYDGDTLTQPDAVRFLYTDIWNTSKFWSESQFGFLQPGAVLLFGRIYSNPVYIAAFAPTRLEYYMPTRAELRMFWPTVAQ